MLTLLRKLIAILRGGAGTREIFLGLMVGFIIGMVPGFNLTLILCIVLILLLNANVGVISLGFLAGKLSCLLLAPYTFELGYAFIHTMGLEGFIRTASDTPVLALFDLDRYCLIGGLPIGIAGGLVLGLIISSVITKIRKKVVAARADNEKLDAMLGKWYIKLVVRVLAGKKPKKGNMAEALDKESPFLRKSGLIVAGGAIVLLLITDLLVLNFGSRQILEKTLSRMNGAEVNIQQADISILSGKASLQGVQVTDPDNPANNLAASETITADFSVSDLLRKRFVVEQVIVGALRMDEARETPGEVFPRPVSDDEDGGKPGDEGTGDQPLLTKYIENWETYKRYINKGKDYLDRALEARKARKKLMTAGNPKDRLKALRALAKQNGYFSMSAKTWLQDKPTWVLQELRAGGISVGTMLPTQTVVLSDVTSAPDLHPAPIRLALVDSTDHETVGCDVKINDDLSNSYEIRGNLKDVAVKDINFGSDVPVVVNGGKGQGSGKGTLAGDGTLAIPFSLALTELDLAAKGEEDVLGMKPDEAKEVFSTITELAISGEIVGSLNSLRVKIDYDTLRDALSDAFKEAGKAKARKEANKAITKEVDKLKDKYGNDVSDKIGAENYKKLEGAADKLDSKSISDAASSLLNGFKGDKTDDNASDDDTKDDPKKKKKSAFDLFK